MEAVGVLGAVGQDMAGRQAFDQVFGAADVVFLTRPADQAHGIAQAVGGGMDLGAQSAAGATQTLGIRPPFLRRAPAACW